MVRTEKIMKVCWLPCYALMAVGFLVIWVPFLSAKKDGAMTHPLLCLSDFSQCAKAAGWQELYVPQASRTVRLTAVEGCPPLGLKANEEVTVVYHWTVLTSVEVPPSRKTMVENGYLSNNKCRILFLAPDKTKFAIGFSSEPAARQVGVGSSVEVVTKANELKLVGVLQQSIAIYSSNHPYMLLQRGYTDTFAYCKFARAQAPEKK